MKTFFTSRLIRSTVLSLVVAVGIGVLARPAAATPPTLTHSLSFSTQIGTEMVDDGTNVWVMLPDKVQKVRKTDLTIQGTVPIPSAAIDIAYDGGFIWVTQAIPGNVDGGNLLKIDPATATVVNTYDYSGAGAPLEASFDCPNFGWGYVEFGDSGQDTGILTPDGAGNLIIHAGGTYCRVRQSDGVVTQTFSNATSRVSDMVTKDGVVFIGTKSYFNVNPVYLKRMNPTTGAILHSQQVGSGRFLNVRPTFASNGDVMANVLGYAEQSSGAGTYRRNVNDLSAICSVPSSSKSTSLGMSGGRLLQFRMRESSETGGTFRMVYMNDSPSGTSCTPVLTENPVVSTPVAWGLPYKMVSSGNTVIVLASDLLLRYDVSPFFSTALPPVTISNVQVTNAGAFSANVSWTTNVPTTSDFVTYNLVSAAATSGSTTHSVQLTGLTSNRAYTLTLTSRATGYTDGITTTALNTSAPYTLSVTPATQNVPIGSPAQLNVTVTFASDFPNYNLNPSYNVSPSFPGPVSPTITPNPIPRTATSVTMSINTDTFPPATVGTSFQFTFFTTDNFTSGTVYGNPVTFTIVPPNPTCTITLTRKNPASFVTAGQLAQGQIGTYDVAVQGQNGFSGSVALSLTSPATAFPAAKVTLPTPMTVGTTGQLQANSTAVTLGTYQLRVKATQGSVTCESATTQIVVSQPSYAIAVTPMTNSVAKNAPADYQVTITPIGTYTAPVVLYGGAGSSAFGTPLPQLSGVTTGCFVGGSCSGATSTISVTSPYQPKTYRVDTSKSVINGGTTYSIKVGSNTAPATAVDGVLLTVTSASTCPDGTATNACNANQEWCDAGGTLHTDCASKIAHCSFSCPAATPFCDGNSCVKKCTDGTSDNTCNAAKQWCDVDVSSQVSNDCSTNKTRCGFCATGQCNAQNQCSQTCPDGTAPGQCNASQQYCRPTDLQLETKCNVNQAQCNFQCAAGTPFCNTVSGICEAKCTDGTQDKTCNAQKQYCDIAVDENVSQDCRVNATQCTYVCPNNGVCDQNTGQCTSKCSDGTDIGACNAQNQFCQADGTLATSCQVNGTNCPAFSCPAATPNCNAATGQCEADTTAPSISAVQCIPDVTSATVKWNTNEPSNSEVLWRPENVPPPYPGGVVTDPVPPGTTSHVVPIQNLQPNTLYYVKVKSTDASNNTNASTPEIPCKTLVAPDTQAPVVQITFPVSGSTIVGSTPIRATATDNTTITKVEFFYNSLNFIGVDTTSSYEVNWSVASLPSGTYALTAKATDTAGNVGVSPQVNVVVNNDTSAPVITNFLPRRTATDQYTVTWNTSEPATSWVYYCVEPIGGGNCVYDQREPVNAGTPFSTSTSIVISRLLTGRNYHLTPISCDAANNCNKPKPF
jgi:hypothetical protein